jgi:FkbM family methyltransferase
MNNKLVYDIGMHLGFDTKMYIEKGYKVIAVEANEFLVRKGMKKFKNEIEARKLQIINCAISEMDNQKLSFFISEADQESSINEQMARNGGNVKVQEVISYKLSTLFKKYGVPHYCKIDIEGYDNIALKTLQGDTDLLPQYISAEINNLSDDGIVSRQIDDENELLKLWTSTLDTLKELGYNKFKLVDQYSLQVFDKNSSYLNSGLYFGTSFLRKLINKYLRVTTCLKFCFSFNRSYLRGSSGPFGKELKGKWEDYDVTKENIISHTKKGLTYGKKLMWCDLHASL